jgi:hypothetical protein
MVFRMATARGYINVFEASDGGTGDPLNTVWQFFVGAQPVTTKNERLAETAQLAVTTASRVDVTYDPVNGNALSQIRMEFKYVCAAELINDCNHPANPQPPAGTHYVCETKRYSPCKPEQLG